VCVSATYNNGERISRSFFQKLKEEELSRDITTSVIILKKLKNYILLDMSSHFIGARVSQLSGTLPIF